MTRRTTILAGAGALVLSVIIGVGIGRMTSSVKPPASSLQEAGRRALYWYDPMVPAQRFDKPGKSPFMDMQLVPKYAGDARDDVGVRIDPAKSQALGMRLVAVERGTLPSAITAAGVIDFNERDVAVVQAKAAGFVERVYARAPGDVVGAGAPLADLLVPEWAGAQGEYLAVRRTGDAALMAAARQRLQLLGMSSDLIAAVERTGRVRNVVTVATPSGGMIKMLGVRSGMAVAAGQTLAEVNGVSRVWLTAAVPETLAGQVRVGQLATATLASYPGETFAGRVAAILPQAETSSRTLSVRIDLPNRSGRLRPGMFASVAFGGPAESALLVPSEAVIRTGRRTLVMVARPSGRFLPADVRVGRESGGRTEVLAGLSAGETVVASGQFLLDSEASLSGVRSRPITSATPATARAASTLYEGVGRIEATTPGSVTISHGPIPAVPWPAMTMQFKLADPGLGRAVKVGDRVAFAFDHPDASPTVRRMTPAGAQ